MNGVPLRVLVEASVFMAICLVAVGSFGYAVWRRTSEAATTKLPAWRQLATITGFLAVAVQASVLAVFWIWPSIGRNYITFGEWARWVLPSFLVALPTVLAGRGSSRWWLLTSSVLLFVISFLIVLSA
jgi:hypothetical protein